MKTGVLFIKALIKVCTSFSWQFLGTTCLVRHTLPCPCFSAGLDATQVGWRPLMGFVSVLKSPSRVWDWDKEVAGFIDLPSICHLFVVVFSTIRLLSELTWRVRNRLRSRAWSTGVKCLRVTPTSGKCRQGPNLITCHRLKSTQVRMIVFKTEGIPDFLCVSQKSEAVSDILKKNHTKLNICWFGSHYGNHFLKEKLF